MGERGNEENGVGSCKWRNKCGTRCWEWAGKRKCGTTKLVAILVLYDAMVLSRCRNLSGTEMILSYVKLTFKSTRGTDTIRKLAETDPKSALRLPKWATITVVKEKW